MLEELDGTQSWSDHEDGPLVPEKILVGVKQYWVGSSGNSTTEDNVKNRKISRLKPRY